METISNIVAQSTDYLTMDSISRPSSPESPWNMSTTDSQSLASTQRSTAPSSINSGFCSPRQTKMGAQPLSLLEVNAALERESVPSVAVITSDLSHDLNISVPSPSINPYERWECAFGFTRALESPPACPTTRAAFVKAVQTEITSAGHIQDGLASYIRAINSGEYHVFDDDFLKDQNTAVDITIGQLFRIMRNLADVIKQAELVEGEDSAVSANLTEAFTYAQPWVKRTRAILVSNHVFYKINYVLGSDKKKAIH